MHKLDILKLQNFITLRKILFINGWLEEAKLKSFNTTFKQMTTNQFLNTRSINTHQLKIRDFKTEKYGRFFILKKCWSDWNLFQNSLKLTLKIQTFRNQNTCHKPPPWTILKLIVKRINFKLYAFYFYTSLLPFILPNLFKIFSISIPLNRSLFFSFSLFLPSLLPALLSSNTQRTRSDLKSYPNYPWVWLLALHQSLPLTVKLSFNYIEPNFLKASLMGSQVVLNKSKFQIIIQSAFYCFICMFLFSFHLLPTSYNIF